MSPPPRSNVGSAELEVLAILWRLGPARVRDVQAALVEQGRPLAYTTVQTMLNRLVKKELVAADAEPSGALLYEAVVTREDVARSRLRRLVEELYDGVAGPLALELIRSQPITRQDAVELRRLIDRLSKESGGR